MSQSQARISFRILVSTDNHLGFKENHHIQGSDSFDAFEEILQIAKRNSVDFLLLGGDLFHELNPTPSCLYRAMSLLQKYIYGSGELTFATKSLTGIYPANYLNENLNIDLPIFIIHGNHDYPASSGENISTLDLLQASYLINYIGKMPNIDELRIEPILFEKGPVKVALYGLGHIKDTRLHYLFEKGKVHFAEPPGNDYMNILILHQNRFKGIRPGVPYKNCIHTNMLPDFFDLIIWGNEHEASDELTEDPVKNFYVYQPGSSIATSLNAGEALPKHVGFFEIYEKKNFRFVPIKLRNQRPLYVKNIELESLLDNKNVKRSKRLDFDDDNEDREKEIVQKLEEEVAQLLEEHEKKYALERKMKVPPLIRIKVEYTGFDIIRIKQLESKFLGKVANEGEVLKFWRKTVSRKNDIKQNEKLNQRFEECLKQKISFETLTSDSSAIISGLLEDILQQSGQKPKILFNHTIFTQNSGQKFTLQTLNNHITDSLNYASTKLLQQKTQQIQAVSKKILAKEIEFSENDYQNTESYFDEISALNKEYDLQLSQIPHFLTQKLQEYSDNKSIEVLGKNPIKLEDKIDEERAELEHEIATTKKKPAAKGKGKKSIGNANFMEDSEEEYIEKSTAPASKIKIEPEEQPKKQTTLQSFLEGPKQKNLGGYLDSSRSPSKAADSDYAKSPAKSTEYIPRINRSPPSKEKVEPIKSPTRFEKEVPLNPKREYQFLKSPNIYQDPVPSPSFARGGDEEEEEEKDWFQDDFGKLFENIQVSKGKKATQNTQKGKKSQGFLMTENEPTKKNAGRRKRDNSFYMEEEHLSDEDNNPLLKKTKKTETNKRDKSPENVKKGGKKGHSFL